MTALSTAIKHREFSWMCKCTRHEFMYNRGWFPSSAEVLKSFKACAHRRSEREGRQFFISSINYIMTSFFLILWSELVWRLEIPTNQGMLYSKILRIRWLYTNKRPFVTLEIHYNVFSKYFFVKKLFWLHCVRYFPIDEKSYPALLVYPKLATAQAVVAQTFSQR